jgi:uncharacterized membrane protein
METYRINREILKALRFPIVIVLLSYALGLILYPKLPFFVPTEWDSEGNVIAYLPKNIALILLPTLALILLLIFVLIPYIDPLRRNYTRFFDTYSIIVSMFVVVICLGQFLILFETFTKLNKVVPGVGLLFNCAVYITVGNYFPRLKQNWFIGIGTPWTYISDKIWRKTQNLTGILLLALGVFYIPFLFIPIPYILTQTSFAFIILIATSLYSLLLFFKYRREDSEVHFKSVKELVKSILYTLTHLAFWTAIFLVLFKF